MKRLPHSLLIGTFLPVCWLGMMLIHEAGHVVGAVLTDSTVTRVVLHPLAISRTDVEPNRQPLIVAWAGPIIGCAIPCVGWLLCRWLRVQLCYLSQFFAGFCLVANGCYLAVGSVDHVGDAGDLLRLGSPMWSLWAFGVVASAAGFRMWNGLGPHFGFGQSQGRVDRAALKTSVALLFVVLAVDVIVEVVQRR